MNNIKIYDQKDSWGNDLTKDELVKRISEVQVEVDEFAFDFEKENNEYSVDVNLEQNFNLSFSVWELPNTSFYKKEFKRVDTEIELSQLFSNPNKLESVGYVFHSN